MNERRTVWIVGPQPEAVFDSREAAEAWLDGDDELGEYVVHAAGEHVDDPRIPEPDGMHFGAG
jgi:hypothetical protein